MNALGAHASLLTYGFLMAIFSRVNSTAIFLVKVQWCQPFIALYFASQSFIVVVVATS